MTDELETLRECGRSRAPERGGATAPRGWDGDRSTSPPDPLPPLGTGPGRSRCERRSPAVRGGGRGSGRSGWSPGQRINSVKPPHVIAVSSLPEAAGDRSAGVPARRQRLAGVRAEPGSTADSSSATRHGRRRPRRHDDPRAYRSRNSRRAGRVDPAGSVGRRSRMRHAEDQRRVQLRLSCGGTHGGAQLLVDTITDGLGVPINHVIEVQFPQFASLVDQLGGLRIRFPVPRDAYSRVSTAPAGCATLDGEQALAFVRSRHYEYDDGPWRVGPHRRPRPDAAPAARAAATRGGAPESRRRDRSPPAPACAVRAHHRRPRVHGRRRPPLLRGTEGRSPNGHDDAARKGGNHRGHPGQSRSRRGAQPVLGDGRPGRSGAAPVLRTPVSPRRAAKRRSQRRARRRSAARRLGTLAHYPVAAFIVAEALALRGRSGVRIAVQRDGAVGRTARCTPCAPRR